MEKIRVFCIKNRIYVSFAILILSVIIAILQVEIFSSSYLKLIYQPFLINLLGASFVLMLIWIVSSTYIALYSNIFSLH